MELALVEWERFDRLLRLVEKGAGAYKVVTRVPALFQFQDTVQIQGQKWGKLLAECRRCRIQYQAQVLSLALALALRLALALDTFFGFGLGLLQIEEYRRDLRWSKLASQSVAQ